LRRSKIPHRLAVPAHPCASRHLDIRVQWLRLLKRVFDIDIEHCPHCDGKLKIIAAIEDPPTIAKIINHLDLPTIFSSQHEINPAFLSN
jgi:hypothetical protein